MASKHIAAVLGVVIGLGASQAGAWTLFEDSFTNDNLLVNDGIGGNWLAADQAAVGAHVEFNGNAMLSNANGAWNVGGIKTESTFGAGSKVEVVFNGAATVVPGSGTTRGAVANAVGSTLITLSDPGNVLTFPNPHNNNNLWALGLEIQVNNTGSVYGFTVHYGTVQAQEIRPFNYVFDQLISENNPLVVEMSIESDGSFVVSLNQSYGGGLNAALVGNVGKPVDSFRVALGSQMMSASNHLSSFASVRVIPEPASLALLGMGGAMLLRRTRRASC